LLGAALRLLDGEPPAAAEPPVADVLNRHLLLATGVPLHQSTLEPRVAPGVADLVPVALAPGEEWAAAFEARAARHDHEGTRGIVTVLERRDPEAAGRLRELRDELAARARAARDRRVEDVRDQVAIWVRDGVLDDERARAAEETLRALAGDRFDFDRVEADLDALHERLMAVRRAAIEGEHRRFAQWLEGGVRIDPADIDRIEKRIDAGDLTTAREFQAQVGAGNPLPEAAGGTGHLGRFYPAFPEAFAGIAVRAGSRARKQETSEGLTGLKDALQRGSDVADLDLGALLAGAEIKIPALRNARREEAREGLRHWQAIGPGPKTDATIRRGVTAILKMIGLEGEPHDGPKEQHRTWVDLEGVRRVGETPLPAFGSRMSPSGDRLRVVLVWRRPGPQQLIELLKGQPEDQTILVFYFGALSAEERRQLAVAARRRPAPVTAVIDDAAIGYLACMPEADWSVAVALTAPFTATNPYAPVGDVPDEMFYGRDDQLGQVTGRARCSFVYGGRQLGKSALLRKAQRDIERTDPSRKVILENIQTVGKAAPAESLWPKLADKLARAGVIPAGAAQRDQVRDAVRDWARDDPGRQVLVLLDEADHFLNQDAVDARFENVTALRDLMDDTGDRFKVVFAGLHQTARFESLPNQPLAHLGTPVAVGPLDAQDAFDLLVRPLAALGFRFPEPLAARVIAEANNAPALVQLFAEELLTRLRRNLATVRNLPYEITRDDVEAVWRDKSLVRGFRDRFEWTLNLDKRYKVIAYTVALHALLVGTEETLSVGELWEQCERVWREGFEDCTSDGFRGLLDECVNLGVLGLSGDRYRLRTPHILNLLGGIDDVEDVLANAGEFELPDAFDAHSYRGVYHDGPERGPLTSAQLARITRPHDLVHVVAGSRALHDDRVYLTLKAEETQRTDLKVHRVVRGELTFDGARGRADRHGGHTVIVVDVPEGRPGERSGERFGRRLGEALAATAARPRGTLAVVLVADPTLTPAWTEAATRDGVELVELRRFDRPAVRQWMSEDSQQGFPDEAGQEALLAATGGWPCLIGHVVHRLAEHGGDRDEALRHCAERLRREPGAFVRSTGVLADPALAAAWRVLAAEEAPYDPGDLATLLDMHGEESVPALAPAALSGRGYTGTADLVEAFRVLGALVPVDGRLACEPVLAEATRLMETGR
ncbi:ATP-binding protein, partial [Actinomadura roseirufa]|uniref:ATP-binding protein n=1 Tax=Actinomadura roseirufa TaxID=2094049 RepID=UPI0013F14954